MSFINHNMHPFDWETLIEEVQPILAEEESAIDSAIENFHKI